MSRDYFARVTIEIKDDKKLALFDAEQAAEDWTGLDEWQRDTARYGHPFRWASARGLVSIGGGMTEEQYAAELSRRVWRAIKAPCEVRVNLTYIGSESDIVRDERDYVREGGDLEFVTTDCDDCGDRIAFGAKCDCAIGAV